MSTGLIDESQLILDAFDGNQYLADQYMDQINNMVKPTVNEEYMNLSMAIIKPKYKNNFMVQDEQGIFRGNTDTEKSIQSLTSLSSLSCASTTINSTTSEVVNNPMPGASLSKSINSFLNIDSKESVVNFTSDAITDQSEQTIIASATEKTQVIQFFVSSIQAYDNPVPAFTGNTTNPNFPTIQFILYDENNVKIGIVGTYTLIGRSDLSSFNSGTGNYSRYKLQCLSSMWFQSTSNTNTLNSNEPYIFLQKGQSLKFRVSPLTGNTAIFSGMSLNIVLNNRIYGDELDIKSYYRLLGPADVDVGTPVTLYKNTSGKTSIVLTASQCGSGNLEPYICPQQDGGPSVNTRFSFFYCFQFNEFDNPSPQFSIFRKLELVQTNTEGYAPMIYDNRGVNCNNPYNSFRLGPGDSIVVGYDTNPIFSVGNEGIPVLISVFILEI
jgi:hypothetical protein